MKTNFTTYYTVKGYDFSDTVTAFILQSMVNKFWGVTSYKIAFEYMGQWEYAWVDAEQLG